MMYDNSRWSLLKVGIHRHRTLFESISTLNDTKLREMREICRCERRVSQFSTSSPANSLPVQETLLQQNKSTLGPEKTDF